jgi:DNA-directed RNA polymerase specialized sigma24 family protein
MVLESMRDGKRGDQLVNTIMGRIGWYKGRGIQAHWQPSPRGLHPFALEGIKGKRRRAEIVIEGWEREFELDGYSLYPPINPFQAVTPESLHPLDSSEILSDTETANQTTPTTQPEIDVSFETSKTLVPKRDRDVTQGWRILQKPIDQLIRDLTPIHFELAGKIRRTYTLNQSWQDDLIQEARMEVWKQLPRYQGRAAFTTWAWNVSWTAMLKYTQRFILRHQDETPRADVFYNDLRTTPGFAETVDLRLTLAEILSKVPDSHLVFLQALGYQDSEIGEGNLRMRRLRARRKLQTALADDLALSA